MMSFNIDAFLAAIFSPNLTHFNDLAEELFAFQKQNNKVLQEFEYYLFDQQARPDSTGFTFLPIDFFKNKRITTTDFLEEAVFTSSSTTGSIPSKHFIKSLSIYEKSFESAFQQMYGSPHEYCILALLPSYLERQGSSLVYMAEKLIQKSNHPQSGFYLNDFKALHATLQSLKQKKQKTILLGVTYALLDFAEQYPLQFPELIVMETGGMKGRREEMIRHEIHHHLQKGFGVQNIHSEYGMTELCSQAYSKKDGKFFTPSWMKILIADPTDPFTFLGPNKTGIIHVIDLANIYSAAFIQTSDLGKLNEDGSFEVLGRLDNSDIRGCSLMYS